MKKQNNVFEATVDISSAGIEYTIRLIIINFFFQILLF